MELPSKRQEMDEEIAAIVRQHGWYAASISDHEPPFHYTIGLMQTCEHPELIVFALDPESAYVLLAGIVAEVRSGRSFAEPGVQTVSVGGEKHRVGFRTVHPTQHSLYLGFAMGYCRHIGRIGQLQAVQAFWPDAAGKFPFEIGCDLDAFRLQRRLDIPLTPSEIRRFERQWE